MSNKWTDVRRKLSPAREARIKERVAAEVRRLPLAEVRQARKMTQESLAKVLHVNQGAVSKLEKRSDMFLSTLREYLEAMGGQLEMRVIFPNGEVILERLTDTERKSKTHSRARTGTVLR